ncbi:MAG: CHAT domain-containing protein [Acidimicrobiia bacterium]|nr:CHAT domain-containing protein [Acidimicrobiia bacterium]
MSGSDPGDSTARWDPISEIAQLAAGWRGQEPDGTAVDHDTVRNVATAFELLVENPLPDDLTRSAAQNDHQAMAAIGRLRQAMVEATRQAILNVNHLLNDRAYDAVLSQIAAPRAVAKLLDEREEVAMTWLIEARAYRRSRRWDLAEPAYQQALSWTTEQALVAVVHDDLGHSLVDQGRTREADEHYAMALAAATTKEAALAILQHQADAYTELGLLHRANHALDEMRRELLGFRDRRRAERRLVDNLHSKAGVAARLGHSRQVSSALDEAGDLARRLGDDHVMITNALLRNRLAAITGDDREATFTAAYRLAIDRAATEIDAEHYRSGLAAAIDQSLDPEHLLWQGFRQAMILSQRGDDKTARDLLERVRNEAYAADDLHLSMRAEGNLIALLSNAGRFGEAAKRARDLHLTARTTGLAVPELMAMQVVERYQPQGDGGLGMLTRMLRLTDAHRQLVDELVPLSHRLLFEDLSYGTVHHELAILARERGATQLALQHERQAVVLGREALVADGMVKRLDGLMLLAVEQGLEGEAAAVANELEKLLPSLRTPVAEAIACEALGRFHATGDGHGDAVTTWFRRAAERLVSLVDGMDRTRRSDFIREHRHIIVNAVIHLLTRGETAEAFQLAQQVKGRRLAELAGDRHVGVRSLTDLQRVLREGETGGSPSAVIDYLILPNKVAVFVVTANDIVAAMADVDVGALSQVDLADVDEIGHRAIAAADDPGLQALAGAAVDATGDGHSLVIVPEGPLCNVPLHTTRVGGQRLDSRRRCGYEAAASRLSFGSSPLAGSAVVAGDSMNDLPEARREAKTVGLLLGVTPLLGDACTTEAVTSRLMATDPAIVHLAVHGQVNPFRGDEAALLFHSSQWVRISELAALDWTARLVVFSGCSTGATSTDSGGDIVGIARAAIEAGASAVIGSLWPVDDLDARLFMEEFYRRLAPVHTSGATGVDLRQLLYEANVAVANHHRGARPIADRRHGFGRADVSRPATNERSSAFVLFGDPIT